MFSRTIRIFFAALFVFYVVPMAALAQDGGNAPNLDEQSGQQLSMFVVTVSDMLQSDPNTIQTLLDLGFTSQQTQELQSESVSSAASSSDGSSVALQSSQQLTSMSCPCAESATSNVIFQTGPGHIFVRHEYRSGLVVHVGAMTCPAHAWFCVWTASTQRPGQSPAWFIVGHTSYAHRIHNWCS